MKGWNCDISGVRRYEDLPVEAKAYVDRLEALIGVPIALVSNGPNREQIMVRQPQ
jgi:adenylosuccinate synthase